MFHQKSRGVSLILFSDGVPEMESVEKPNYARYGHGASILDYTISRVVFCFVFWFASPSMMSSIGCSSIVNLSENLEFIFFRNRSHFSFHFLFRFVYLTELNLLQRVYFVDIMTLHGETQFFTAAKRNFSLRRNDIFHWCFLMMSGVNHTIKEKIEWMEEMSLGGMG